MGIVEWAEDLHFSFESDALLPADDVVTEIEWEGMDEEGSPSSVA